MVIKSKEHDELLLFEATTEGVEAYFINTALKYYRQNGKVRKTQTKNLTFHGCFFFNFFVSRLQ